MSFIIHRALGSRLPSKGSVPSLATLTSQIVKETTPNIYQITPDDLLKLASITSIKQSYLLELTAKASLYWTADEATLNQKKILLVNPEELSKSQRQFLYRLQTIINSRFSKVLSTPDCELHRKIYNRALNTCYDLEQDRAFQRLPIQQTPNEQFHPKLYAAVLSNSPVGVNAWVEKAVQQRDFILIRHLNSDHLNSRSPITLAASKGYVEVLRQLLTIPLRQNGEPYRGNYINHNTLHIALKCAAFNGHINVVELLLEDFIARGIDIYDVDPHLRCTAYDLALIGGHNEVAAMLRPPLYVEANPDWKRVFDLAIVTGNTSAIKKVHAEHKDDLNYDVVPHNGQDQGCICPYEAATVCAVRSLQFDVIPTLAKLDGFDINNRPLLATAIENHFPFSQIKRLIQCGAKVDFTVAGFQSFQAALRNGYTDLLDLFISIVEKENIEIDDFKLRNLLETSASRGHSAIVLRLASLALPETRFSAFVAAAKSAQSEVVDQLLREFSIPRSILNKALVSACTGNHSRLQIKRIEAVARSLLNKGADVNTLQRANRGQIQLNNVRYQSPLSATLILREFEQHSPSLVSLLTNHGADTRPLVQTRPLHSWSNNTKVLRILERNTHLSRAQSLRLQLHYALNNDQLILGLIYAVIFGFFLLTLKGAQTAD